MFIMTSLSSFEGYWFFWKCNFMTASSNSLGFHRFLWTVKVNFKLLCYSGSQMLMYSAGLCHVVLHSGRLSKCVKACHLFFCHQCIICVGVEKYLIHTKFSTSLAEWVKMSLSTVIPILSKNYHFLFQELKYLNELEPKVKKWPQGWKDFEEKDALGPASWEGAEFSRLKIKCF